MRRRKLRQEYDSDAVSCARTPPPAPPRCGGEGRFFGLARGRFPRESVPWNPSKGAPAEGLVCAHSIRWKCPRAAKLSCKCCGGEGRFFGLARGRFPRESVPWNPLKGAPAEGVVCAHSINPLKRRSCGGLGLSSFNQLIERRSCGGLGLSSFNHPSKGASVEGVVSAH